MLKNTSLANISTPISLYNSKYSLNKKQDVCKVGGFFSYSWSSVCSEVGSDLLFLLHLAVSEL